MPKAARLESSGGVFDAVEKWFITLGQRGERAEHSVHFPPAKRRHSQGAAFAQTERKRLQDTKVHLSLKEYVMCHRKHMVSFLIVD